MWEERRKKERWLPRPTPLPAFHRLPRKTGGIAESWERPSKEAIDREERKK